MIQSVPHGSAEMQVTISGCDCEYCITRQMTGTMIEYGIISQPSLARTRDRHFNDGLGSEI